MNTFTMTLTAAISSAHRWRAFRWWEKLANLASLYYITEACQENLIVTLSLFAPSLLGSG